MKRFLAIVLSVFLTVCCLGGAVYAQEMDEKVEQDSAVSKSEVNAELLNQTLRSENVRLTGAMLPNAELSTVRTEELYGWEIKVSCLGELYEPAGAQLWFTFPTSGEYHFYYVNSEGVKNEDWGYQVVSSNEAVVPFLGNGTYVFASVTETTTETEPETETTTETVLRPEITTAEMESETTTAAEIGTTTSDTVTTKTAEPVRLKSGPQRLIL